MTQMAPVENEPSPAGRLSASGAHESHRPDGDGPKREDTRHYSSFAFYKFDPDFLKLSKSKRSSAVREFMGYLDSWSQKIQLHAYSTQGTRSDVDFTLWRISPRLDDIHAMSVAIRKIAIGAYLRAPYSYLSMTKKSMYVDASGARPAHRHPGQEGTRLFLEPSNARYLFVYPFVKTHEWYQLPMEDRQKMMSEHIDAGHRFPTVKVNTTYAFGLDDPEFVVAFESDHPGDFLDLVMALRASRARPYTERDTPIFTCIRKTFKELCAEF